MGVKLFKELVTINEGKADEKKFYTFYLRLENGEKVRIQPNAYKTAKGNVKSNYDVLFALATTELPFDR